VSPRVVSAQVIGTKGATPTDGVTLRSRLGLYDTWFSFKAKRTKAKKASSGATAASAAASVRRALRHAAGA
jgi:stage II sporulation protein D